MSLAVGRERETARVRELLDAERIVTLTGPIGVGKSRVARDALEGRPVVRCDASRVESTEALVEAVAEALGGLGDLRGVGDALDARGSCLVWLDGCDLEGAGAVVAAWLEQAPASSWLVTTRGRLGIESEVVVEIEPLGAEAAVELFLRAVRRHRPGYEPKDVDARFLADLARELDGLPLALELAAPRLSVMSPAALLHRLRSGGAKLGGPLALALDGAWQALAAPERDALTQLAAFAGGFDLEAAEAVLSPAEGALDRLEHLRARSLVGARGEGDLRLSLLRSVRDHAVARGDARVLAEARARHASHFARRLAQSGGDRAWLALERDNLVAVIDGVLATAPVDKRRAEAALGALVALFPPHGEALPPSYLAILQPALHATRDSGADPLLVTRALLVSGAAERRCGNAAAALRELTRALHLAERLATRELEGAALFELAQVLRAQGEEEAARDHAVRALARGAGPAEAAVLVLLGELEAARGAWQAGRLYLERAVALQRQRGEDELRARVALARLLLDAGQHAAAAKELSGTSAEGALVAAWIAHDSGGGGEAGYEAAERLARAHADGETEGLALGLHAILCIERGEPARAHALFRAAFEIGGQLGGATPIFRALSSALDASLALPPASARDDDAIASAIRARRLDELRERGKTSSLARLALRAITADTAATSVTSDALGVGGGGRWFRLPQAGEPLSLERRKPLARLLDRLADERLQRPGNDVSWEELQEAGWPGERVLPTAAAHRVRVAISSLRKLGLGGLLVTGESGYLLDPAYPLVREA